MLCPNCFTYNFDGQVCSNCGFLMEGDNLEDMKIFYKLKNRYLIGRSLGAGGFGITYIAYDTKNDCRVCVKEYFPMGLVVRSNDGVTIHYTRQNRIEEFRHGIERFMEEAKIIGELNNISGVVKIVDCFEENGTAYYVMEYLDGLSLKRIVPPGGMPLETANEIIRKIGRNIDIVHKEKGYLHRDISPENIMVLSSGRVVLIDFGSAKNFFLSSSNYTITLKHGFAPIEQYSTTDTQGPFTDLYALASTYYYMLTKKVIPRAPDRLAGVEYEPLHSARHDISRSLSDVVDRALAIDPKNRTKTVGEFIDELEEIVGESGEESNAHYVKVYIDGQETSRIKVEPDKWLTAGCLPSSDIPFTGCQSVSRVHCNVMFDSYKQRFCLEDHSTNGTYINNVRMNKDMRYYVEETDIILLANTRYRLILGG